MSRRRPQVVLHSPLDVATCAERLRDHTVRPSFGGWIKLASGDRGPELHT